MQKIRRNYSKNNSHDIYAKSSEMKVATITMIRNDNNNNQNHF